jgi:hypothetical protein
MFHVYRHGKSMQKAPPPKPTLPPMPMKAKPPSLPKTAPTAGEVAAGSKVLEDSVTKEKAIAPSTKASTSSSSSSSSSQSVQSVNKTESTGPTHSEHKVISDEKK